MNDIVPIYVDGAALLNYCGRPVYHIQFRTGEPDLRNGGEQVYEALVPMHPLRRMLVDRMLQKNPHIPQRLLAEADDGVVELPLDDISCPNL